MGSAHRNRPAHICLPFVFFNLGLLPSLFRVLASRAEDFLFRYNTRAAPRRTCTGARERAHTVRVGRAFLNVLWGISGISPSGF